MGFAFAPTFAQRDQRRQAEGISYNGHRNTGTGEQTKLSEGEKLGNCEAGKTDRRGHAGDDNSAAGRRESYVDRRFGCRAAVAFVLVAVEQMNAVIDAEAEHDRAAKRGENIELAEGKT